MILDKIKSCFVRADKCFLKEHIMAFYTRYFKYRGKAYVLDENIYFPPHTSANKNMRLGPMGELLAVGGDLSPERMIYAYKNGVCPCSFKNQPLLWWTSEKRCVIFPEAIHISKVVKRLIKQRNYKLTVDKAFNDVQRGCCEGREEYTWITPERLAASSKLHELGFAHSVEVWRDEELIAGLYGVAFGSYFNIASKFTRINHGSKLVMIALAIRLEELQYKMLDCGIWPTEHLIKMGAVNIPQADFLEQLNECRQVPDIVENWSGLFENWDFVEAIQNHELKRSKRNESENASLRQ